VAALSDRDDGPDESEETEPMVLINPEIVARSTEVEEDWEGCLSIPDIRGRVPRASAVTVKAFDRNGTRIEIDATGFSARVIQHEYDHLDGVLFFDRMRSFETLAFLDEYSKYWARSDD
jgi:peptide deformylase